MNRSSGTSGALAIMAAVLLVAAIVGLLALDSWWALALALVLLFAGVFVLTRFVDRLGWTPRPGGRARPGVQGMQEELSTGDPAHDELSPHDLPLENPAHHEIGRTGGRAAGRGGAASRP